VIRTTRIKEPDKLMRHAHCAMKAPIQAKGRSGLLGPMCFAGTRRARNPNIQATARSVARPQKANKGLKHGVTGFRQFVTKGAALCVDDKQAGLCAFKGSNARPQSVKRRLHVASATKGPGQHGQGRANVARRHNGGRSNGGRSNGAALVEKASGGRRGGDCVHSGGFLVCGGRAPKNCFNVKAKVARNVNSARGT
jgi:hypothetical protein